MADEREIGGQGPAADACVAVRVVDGPDLLALKFLAPGRYSVGRGADSDLRLPVPVGRLHAILTVEPDAVFIEDAGSLAGTYVDDKIVRGRVALPPGSRARIGPYFLTVEPVTRGD